MPYSTLNFQHATSGLIGAGDADITVSLKEDHHPTADYIADLRRELPAAFPGTILYFLPSDIVTQILNFGLPAPIDVQFEGQEIAGNRVVADKMLEQLRQVPGLVDLRIQQPDDYPVLTVDVDRTKAQQGGLTEKDVGSSLLNILSGSTQLSPQFFLNYKNGVNYSIVAQSPQYDIQSLNDLRNIPITSATAQRPEILADVANIKRESEMQVISHYNIRRTLDIYGNVQGRDLGSVGKQIQKIVDANRKDLPRGSFLRVRGQIETMNSSYFGLIAGLAFAIVLVYLLIVVNFQSWLDPFIIITALPAALSRHRDLPLHHAHHAERSRADGCHHVYGRCHGQQHSGRVFCQGAPQQPRRRDHGRRRSWRHPLPSRHDDGACHDHRHDSHGAGRW